MEVNRSNMYARKINATKTLMIEFIALARTPISLGKQKTAPKLI